MQQERLAAFGQLAAGIAHAFNNILAVIIIYGDMLLATPELPPKHHHRMEISNRQTALAAHLVQQILDFGRRAVLQTSELALALLLEGLVGLWRRTLPESINIRYSGQTAKCTIHADPSRLQQMFTNLALNARDAMPNGGDLHICLDCLQLDAFDPAPLSDMTDSNWAQITVRDTGTAIADEALAHVFEPFFTTKEPGKGSGLGLAQAYGVAKQHRGHINVQTEVGRGTTFTIYLPLLTAPTMIRTAVYQSNPPQGHGEVILVVEDNDSLREALANALTMLNYLPLTAANGREALEILAQPAAAVLADDKAIQAAARAGIALLLCDLIMPEMGGKKLLQTMRQRGLTVPAVIISGHPLEDGQLTLQTISAVGWLNKPPGMHELATAVAQALHFRPIDE